MKLAVSTDDVIVSVSYITRGISVHGIREYFSWEVTILDPFNFDLPLIFTREASVDMIEVIQSTDGIDQPAMTVALRKKLVELDFLIDEFEAGNKSLECDNDLIAALSEINTDLSNLALRF